MGVLYLLALLVALFGMVMLDRRFRLFFWRDARRAGIVLGVGLLFFLAWDLCGIGLGIFFRGETSFMTGLQVAPELPIEEPFFLLLLCYLAMNLYGFLTRSGLDTPTAAGGLTALDQRGESGSGNPATPAGGRGGSGTPAGRVRPSRLQRGRVSRPTNGDAS